YALLTLEVAGYKSDEVTSAVARFLLGRDAGRDRWRSSSSRPPSEASEFTTTYVALRALATFGPESDSSKRAERRDKARRWLESAEPKETEDRVFRLLGLKATSASDKVIQSAAGDLRKLRRDDGGWAQREGDP